MKKNRINLSQLEDVCLDCCDLIKIKLACKTCAVEKLKWKLLTKRLKK